MVKVRWHQRLTSQAMVIQLLIIAFVLLIVSLSFARSEQDALEEQYGLRAQSIAASVAEVPTIRQHVSDGTISPDVQKIAEEIRSRTDVDFVVVADAKGVRYSHPNPDRIGKELSTDPGPALAGISDWYIQTGTLGPSVRGKVPITDPSDGQIVGIVSVGILTGEISTILQRRIIGQGTAAAVVFGAASIASWLGARRIRRQTLGLEPPEIASLYEHRDGLLRALKEGVVAVDNNGRITLINEAATSMLLLGSDSLGQHLGFRPDLEDLLRLSESLTPQVDVPFQVDNQTLVVTCAPFEVRDQQLGAVFTIRDRTELRGLVSELESAQTSIDALRSQAHEHSNNLHTISGLIELQQYQGVLDVVDDYSTNQREIADLYGHRTGGDTLIVASLLVKAAIAAERNIRIRAHIADLPQIDVDVSRHLVTIVGNLVDNAVDHLTEIGTSGGEVEVGIWSDKKFFYIDVSDSGHGIGTDIIEHIFSPGFTTKNERSHDGLGLTLVSELIDRYNGEVQVNSDPGSGTLFSVSLSLPTLGNKSL